MVIKRDILFDPAGETRTLHIYLPDDYNDTDERYPVMYCYDGHNLYYDKDATYGKSWGFKEFLDSWPKKMIMVGIECSHTDRLNEYSPYDNKGGFLGDLKGTGLATNDWIAHTLKPMIDKEYRTYSFREATGICGSSMGGLMALHAGIVFNETFSKCACVSSAISFCMKNLKAEIDKYDLDGDSRFYLSWGEHESGKYETDPAIDSIAAKNNYQIAAWLEEEGVLTEVEFQKDGNHCEASWQFLVPEFMDYLWMR